jgi:hypothetical protein
MPAMSAHAHDDDVLEALRAPSPVDAQESLHYWRARLDGLPRHRRGARREARAMVVAWEERVRRAEVERWGGGWIGRAAGGVAVLRGMGAAAAVRRVVRLLVPGRLVVGVLTVLFAMTLLAGVLVGAIASALF